MKIWSLRWTVAWGHHWTLERECAEDTLPAWLRLFRRDEPAVTFVAADKKPHTFKPQ